MSTKNTMDEAGLAHKVPYRLDLLPWRAIMAAAEVMAKGVEDHPKEGWRKMSVWDLINHALGHIIMFFMKRNDEDHLAHALCRVAMAWEVHYGKREEFINMISKEMEEVRDTRVNNYIKSKVQEEHDQYKDPILSTINSSKVIYLCYPYKDNPERRTRIISEVAREIRDKYPDKLVLVPHLLFQYMNETTQRDKILQMCLDTVKLCDTLLVVGDTVSDGMTLEVAEAVKLEKKIGEYSEAEAKKKVEIKEHEELTDAICTNHKPYKPHVRMDDRD